MVDIYKICPVCQETCAGNETEIIAYCVFSSADNNINLPHTFLYYNKHQFDLFIRLNSIRIELVMNRQQPYLSIDGKVMHIDQFDFCQALDMLHKYFKLRLFF